MYSFVLIKVSKCGTETVRNFIKKKINDKKLILDSAYEGIFQKKNKQFKYSINHINYDEYFINHLKKIMIGNIKYIGFIRNPLERLISHFYYSNYFNTQMTFEIWYNNDLIRNQGWNGGCKNSKNSLDVTNNFMSRYLGFTSLEEITKENIKNKYYLIIRLEDPDKYKKLMKILNFEIDSDLNFENVSKKYNKNNLNISQKTKDLFEKNNEMDIRLYKLVSELY